MSFETANVERWEAGMDVSSYEDGKNCRWRLQEGEGGETVTWLSDLL